MKHWFAQWRLQAKHSAALLAVVSALVVLLLMMDFVQRIWVPRGSGNAADFQTLAALKIEDKSKAYSNEMQQWLEQVKTQQSIITDGTSVDATAKVLAGALNLTSLRIRVRAVFIKQQPAVALALAELQTLSDGKVQLQRLETGSEVDGYRVTSIQKGLVVFSQLTNPANQLSVPVFKGENP
jgi:hypothetical protein